MIPDLLDMLEINAEKIHKIKGGIILSGSRVVIQLPDNPVRFLYSGWQSWSLTAWVNIDRPILPMRPAYVRTIHADPVYATENHPNGSWYAAVEFSNGNFLFLGSLDLESHIRLDGQTLVGWYETGGGEWFVATGNEQKSMSHYAGLLGDRLGKKERNTPFRVWCSWNSLFTEIHEKQLLKILSDLGPFNDPQGFPFDIIQIDDGWQRGFGNWEPNVKFPSGMENLAACIKETGRKAGIWLAPLLITPSSSIYQENQDWLLKDEKGALVSAGFNWGEPLFALDTTNPWVLDWLSNLMRRVRSWGYDYFKLDFLYAGALPGKRFTDIPRETAYRNGLKVIRAALGDAYLLACGAPILPSIGLCDGIRTSADVASFFISGRDDNLLMDFAMPGARNAMRSTFNRLWLQDLMDIDPDVVFFRTRQNKLSSEQKELLQDLAQICNFKGTSDIPAWLSPSESSALRAFLGKRVLIRKTGQTTFQVGDHEVDFEPHISLPPLPGRFTFVLGAMLGKIGNIPFVNVVLFKLLLLIQKRLLTHNPV